MCDKLLSVISGCSSESKQKLRSFLESLFAADEGEAGEVLPRLEGVFRRLTHHLSLNKIREISKCERNRKDLTHYQFNYGEIVPLPARRPSRPSTR